MRWAIVRFPGSNCDEDARFSPKEGGDRGPVCLAHRTGAKGL
jgi:phosphoribosylformylglycinamidine (FGAM) synthase-like amidotransferase family enzyme